MHLPARPISNAGPQKSQKTVRVSCGPIVNCGPSHCLRFVAIFAVLCAPIGVQPVWAGRRRVRIGNGVLMVTIDLPNPLDGVYRGTRFDWSGVIERLSYAGHTFYGRWFTRTDPTVRDFIFVGQQIVAGPSSAITGPAEEFLSDGAALGYRDAPPGGTFVKIGVGVLRKPDRAKYDRFRLYQIVDSGKWTVRVGPRSVKFRQRLIDPTSGYGYIYEKTIRLLPGKSEMLIEHCLRNIGRRTIDTDVYDHNFLVLDHRTTGPDFVITLPFHIDTPKPVNATLGEIQENRILYRRNLKRNEVFATRLGGFRSVPEDYDIQIENAHAGVGMKITADRPLAREELWSIRSIIGVEPYLHMTIAPGRTFSWRYFYRYYSLPSKIPGPD
jgi:hypothetical protein